MESVLALVQQHAELAPFVVFGLLVLAGFNLPISEDAMILGSALLASERPDLLPQLLLAVYAGAYLGDLICYTLGRRFGPALWRIPGFERLVPARYVLKLSTFYTRYGVWLLLVGRFVPFGVRNALLLTAGLGRMPFWRLALTDLVAATFSCGASFWLYFTYGQVVVEKIAQSQLALLAGAACVIALFMARKRLVGRLERD
jgi:membrane-associated protein